MTDIRRSATAYLPFSIPFGVFFDDFDGSVRFRVQGDNDDEVLERAVELHDRIGAEVFRLRTLINEQKNREMSGNCKGAECYGCPVACPEKGFDIPAGTRG